MYFTAYSIVDYICYCVCMAHNTLYALNSFHVHLIHISNVYTPYIILYIVFINYGEKSNADLLLLYGFSLDRNPFNAGMWYRV